MPASAAPRTPEYEAAVGVRGAADGNRIFKRLIDAA